jgi:hypothetical protein
MGKNSKWQIKRFLLREVLNSGRAIVIPLVIEFERRIFHYDGIKNFMVYQSKGILISRKFNIIDGNSIGQLLHHKMIDEN